jgi:hypothetical protein
MSQQSTSPAQLPKLRGVVRDALDKHVYESAIFFADKLLTLSNSMYIYTQNSMVVKKF